MSVIKKNSCFFSFFLILFFKNFPVYSMELKPLVILMEFSDYMHTEINKRERSLLNKKAGIRFTPQLYSEMLYGRSGYIGADGRLYISAARYFLEESGGNFKLRGSSEDIYGWYSAQKKIRYYGKNMSGKGDRLRASSLVSEGIGNLVKNRTDFSKYDLDRDGILDCVIIVHAGKGEHWDNSLGSHSIWPFFNRFYEISKDKYYEFKDHRNRTWKVDKFAVMDQDLTVDLFVHEIGHFIGLNDLYGHDSPVKYWSPMASIYSGELPGTLVNSLGAYPRMFLQKDFEKKGYGAGWAKIKEYDLEELLNNPKEFYLFPATDKERTNLVRINLPDKGVQGSQVENHEKKSSSRYYLLEWRDPRRDGIDSGLLKTFEKIPYQGGLLIWYIDESIVGHKGRAVQYSENGRRFVSVVDADPSPVFKVKKGKVSHYRSRVFSMYDSAFSLRNTSPLFYKADDLILYHESLVFSPYFNSKGLLYPQHSRGEYSYLPEDDIKILVLQDHTAFGKIAIYSGMVKERPSEIRSVVTKDYIYIKLSTPYEVEAVLARLSSEKNILERMVFPYEKIEKDLLRLDISKLKGNWDLEYVREIRPKEYRAYYNGNFTEGWGMDMRYYYSRE